MNEIDNCVSCNVEKPISESQSHAAFARQLPIMSLTWFGVHFSSCTRASSQLACRPTTCSICLSSTNSFSFYSLTTSYNVFTICHRKLMCSFYGRRLMMYSNSSQKIMSFSDFEKKANNWITFYTVIVIPYSLPFIDTSFRLINW